MDADDEISVEELLASARPPRWLGDRDGLGRLLDVGSRLAIRAIETDARQLATMATNAHVGLVRADEIVHYVPTVWHRQADFAAVARFLAEAERVFELIHHPTAVPLSESPAGDFVVRAALVLGVLAAIDAGYDGWFEEADGLTASYRSTYASDDERETAIFVGRIFWQEGTYVSLLGQRRPGQCFGAGFSGAFGHPYHPTTWFRRWPAEIHAGPPPGWTGAWPPGMDVGDPTPDEWASANARVGAITARLLAESQRRADAEQNAQRIARKAAEARRSENPPT